MTALLGSPWLAVVLAVVSLAAVAAGAGLGATWDHLAATARGHLAACRSAVADYRTPPTGGHRG